MRSNKEILIDSIPNLSVTLIILAIIIIFSPPFIILIQALVAFTLVRAWYKYYTLDFPDGYLWLMALEILSLLAIVIPIYFFYEIFGAKGLWSLVVVVLFLSAIVLWRVRRNFVEILRDIERKHFGESREERRERLKNE